MAKKKQAPEPSLFNDTAENGHPAQATYVPLPSVWDGSDAELLEKMLDFYPHATPKKILDATVNAGRFWIGSTRPVIGMDIDASHKPDVVGDNTAMLGKAHA